MRNNKGQFVSGHKTWNKGRSDFRPSPETEFKVGGLVAESHPSWKGGVQMPQNDCAYEYIGVNKRVRRPRKVYEEHFGEIPKGYVVIHTDGDKYNDDPSNLEAISRAENLKRNSLKKGINI